MKYVGKWIYPLKTYAKGTTFDNSLQITESGSIVSTANFDSGMMTIGQSYNEAALTASMTASTSGDSWDVKFLIADTLNSFDYCHYSVIFNREDYKYEVIDGIIYIKYKIGGDDNG